MARRFIVRRWRGLAAVGAIASLVASVCLVSPSRGDDKPAEPRSANAKPAETGSKHDNGAAKTATDPFAVPDGNAQALLKFIAKARTIRAPRKQSPADARAFMVKKCAAIVAAADKILAAEPTGNVRLSALQSKLQALSALDGTGDDQAGTKLAALVGEIKADKQPGLANLARRYSMEADEVTSSTTAAKIDIKASHLDGTPFDPSTITRKVTLVELWTTTCGNCRAEMPSIARDYAKYRNRGFEVVGISLDSDKSSVQKYLQENPSLAWQIVVPKSGVGIAYRGQQFGQFSTPKMILVNRHGAIISDSVTDEQLTAKLAELLGR